MKPLFLLLLFLAGLYARQENKPFLLQSLDGTINLDGIVNEDAWQNIAPLPLVSHWPEFGNPPADQTEIRVSYDQKYIYVSGVMKARPENILAASFKRDIWTLGTDYLTITLDTYNDNENALSFSTTPTGSRTDAAVSGDAQYIDTSWDTFWDCEAVYDSTGWSAEMRIPFASLGFQEKEGEVTMGLAVMRYTARKNEMFVFPAIEPNWGFWSWLKPSQLQKAIFKNIKSHNPLYVTPYALAGQGMENELNEAETKYRKKNKFSRNVGLDIRYNVTDNLTLDFSFNTDFAQVEVDDQQVNLTRFSLFFPEKRRFFLERANIFDFKFSGFNRLFYTRQIGINDRKDVDILAGARLTGRIGDWDVGLLNVQTGEEKGLPAENFAVLRLKKQIINSRSFIGGMATNRVNSDGHFNLGIGLDGVYNLFNNDYLSFSLVQTHSDTVNDQVNFKKASRARFRWERRSYTGFAYDFSVERAGREYQPGMGYESREDFGHINSKLSWGWTPKGHPYLQSQRYSLGYDVYTRNKDNSIETMEIGPLWDFALLSGFYMEAGPKITYENLKSGFDLDNVHIAPGEYTFGHFYSYFRTKGGLDLSTEGIVNIGQFYDGIIYSIALIPKWIASKYIELTPYYEFNRIEAEDRRQKLTSHVSRLNGLITLSIRLSLSAFIQYNSNEDMVFSNARFRYNPSEGHDFYLVYNELLNTDRKRYEPIRPLIKNRTIIAKYTYTFTY